jgi:hypothetical protein
MFGGVGAPRVTTARPGARVTGCPDPHTTTARSCTVAPSASLGPATPIYLGYGAVGASQGGRHGTYTVWSSTAVVRGTKEVRARAIAVLA